MRTLRGWTTGWVRVEGSGGEGEEKERVSNVVVGGKKERKKERRVDKGNELELVDT